MSETSVVQGNNAFWRPLLGTCNDWPIELQSDLNEQSSSVEFCELCCNPIETNQPFIANSAGQQAVHVACLVGEELAIQQATPAKWQDLIWRRFQRRFSRVATDAI